MRKLAIAIMALVVVCLCLSCAPSYKVTLEEQTESDNVTPITLDEATDVQNNEPVVTFVISSKGISVDSVVSIGNFHKGAEADVVYLIRNETDWAITPRIYYRYGTCVDDYSEVDGEGFVDAPDFVEDWITITPESFGIPPQSGQGFIVALTMPEDAPDIGDKYAFQVGVAVGQSLAMSVSPWWLVYMR